MRGMKMRPALFILPVILFLTACLGGQEPAPVSNFGQSPGAGSAGVHSVSSGETVYALSKRYNIAMRDIIVVNDLRAPFRLTAGQRVKLPPPQEYRVREGDSLYTVSRLFGVNSSEVAKMNRINAPYTLRTGQVLRLPSVARKMESIKPGAGAAAQQAFVPPRVPSVQGQVLAPPPSSAHALGNGSVSLASPASSPLSGPVKAPSAKVIPASVPPRSGAVFMRPVSGPIVSEFGPKKSGLHNDGVNIKAAKGTPVRAAENGVVAYAGNELKGSGNLVLLRHEGQWITAYGHMDSIAVTRGAAVRKGETIGTVGTTGSVAAPQLHFEVRRGTEALNPVNYMDQS